MDRSALRRRAGPPEAGRDLLEAGAQVDAPLVGRLIDGTRFNVGRTERVLDACGQAMFMSWDWGYSKPLLVAARANAQRLAMLRLDRGAYCHATDDSGRMALHHAAANAAGRVVVELLRRGADVNARKHDGGTPLHEALTPGARKVIVELLARGASFSARKYTGTQHAARRGKHPAALRKHRAHQLQERLVAGERPPREGLRLVSPVPLVLRPIVVLLRCQTRASR